MAIHNVKVAKVTTKDVVAVTSNVVVTDVVVMVDNVADVDVAGHGAVL